VSSGHGTQAKGSRPNSSAVVAAVQPVLTAAAQHYNASFSFGFADGRANDASGTVAGASLDDSCRTKPCPGTLIPVGSSTKAWTAVAVLQLVDAGVLNLSSKVYTLIDQQVLQPQCGATMGEMWPTAAIQRVSVRDLLSMRSGIQEYDGVSAPHSWSPACVANGGRAQCLSTATATGREPTKLPLCVCLAGEGS
jgi:CubicO group peptidase (beta-lactamase class C family)